MKSKKKSKDDIAAEKAADEVIKLLENGFVFTGMTVIDNNGSTYWPAPPKK